MPDLPWDKPKKKKTSDPIALRIIEGGKVGTKGYIGKNAKGLTPKQEMFVNEMLKGSTASAAYRVAYNAENMKPHTIQTEASKLLGHPVITKVLKEGFEKKREAAVHNATSLRRHIVDRLFIESTNAGTDAARIAALTALGKLDFVGIFKERISHEDDNRTAEEIREELEEKLKAAFDRDTA